MHVILNGVNSRTIQGLEITSLPPVSAPPKRTNQILIDGRDGDILEDLGYSAYDKAFTILLHNNYDPDEVIGFFSQSGTAIFSNEPDMVYTYEMVNGIDISKGNFNSVKVATITFHVQPYKLSATEEPATGEVSTLVDKTPYIIRRTPFGARQKGTIVGGSIVWNQLLDVSTVATKTNQGITYTNNGDGSITLTGTPTSTNGFENINYVSGVNPYALGHVYLLFSGYTGDLQIGVRLYGIGSQGRDTFPNGYTMRKATELGANGYARFQVSNLKDTDIGTVKLTPQLFDLTLMFGPTIADYIYTQEQATAGAGVALAKAWARITADYIPYDAGSIKSVTGLTAHKMTGKNLIEIGDWTSVTSQGITATNNGDGSITINGTATATTIVVGNLYLGTAGTNWQNDGKKHIPNGRYLCTSGFSTSQRVGFQITGSNGSTISIIKGIYTSEYVDIDDTYQHNWVRINVASGTYDNVTIYPMIRYADVQDATFEPYTAHTYPLDSSLTLRGLPKLDGDNLYYDGDIYPPSGEVKRRYGVRAYQSGDESDANVLTDGTNTVYKLATPTAEQAEPYTALQICDTTGTEEWVGANMPVGHDTTYIDPISMTVTNEGNTESAPSITIEGEGAVEVTVDGLNILQIQMPASGEITIDSKTLDATDGGGGLANRSVTGDYNDLRLAPGEHTVTVTGDVTSVTLKNASRWI